MRDDTSCHINNWLRNVRNGSHAPRCERITCVPRDGNQVRATGRCLGGVRGVRDACSANTGPRGSRWPLPTQQAAMQAPTGSTTGTDERSSASSPLQQATETPALKPYNGGLLGVSPSLSLSPPSHDLPRSRHSSHERETRRYLLGVRLGDCAWRRGDINTL